MILPAVLVVAALVAAAFFSVLWLYARNSPHRHLFTAEHYLEFFSSVSDLRDNLTAAGQPAEGPREASFTTSAGLFVLYTIQPAKSRVLHHYSISSRQARIALAAGGLFSFLVAHALEIDTRGLRLAYSRNGVTHAAFLADSRAQSSALKRPVAIPDRSEIDALYEAAAAKRDGAIAEALKHRTEADLLRRVFNDSAAA